MNELSIGVGVHCDSATSVALEVSKAAPQYAAYKCLKILGGGYGHLNVFLTDAVAAAIHRELERVYPELATPADPSPTEVVMHYAESHATEVAASEDDAIAAMVAELADSPNARKFGSDNATTNAT